jgi:hypothetical protein
MRGISSVALVVGLAFGLPGLGRAEDQPEARAIVAKAAKALGDEATVAKDKAVTIKGKGKFYGMGQGIDYTGEWWIQYPGQMKFEIDSSVNGMKFKFTQVLNGDKGWLKIADMEMELDKDGVEEAKEELYAQVVETLWPLKDEKMYQLALLGESKVGDRPVVGVKVASKGHRDINLYLDKDSSLLLKSERRIKDRMAGGQELTQETLHSDYKEIGGWKYAHKGVVNRDGKKYVEFELTELKTLEKLDDSIFGKP